MRRATWIIATAVALVATGVALAHGFDARSVKAVSATFTATTASNLRTQTCTGADGTYVSTRGTYSGTAAGDPTLAGPVTIDASSLINTTTKVGTVSGFISVDIAGDHNDVSAPFSAVYSNGTIAGLASGRAGDAQLVANVAAAFNATAGFTSGMLGGGTSGGTAVELAHGSCQPVQPPRPDKIRVHGTVTAVTAGPTGSITAAGVTCIAGTGSPVNALGNVHVGDRVEMSCLASGGTNTLVELSGDHH